MAVVFIPFLMLLVGIVEIGWQYATGAMLDRVRVQVALRRYGGPRGGTARVVIDGEFYEVSAAVIEALEEGYTPESLQLEPLDCDVEDC